jgi:hypothetical protein
LFGHSDSSQSLNTTQGGLFWSLRNFLFQIFTTIGELCGLGDFLDTPPERMHVFLSKADVLREMHAFLESLH